MYGKPETVSAGYEVPAQINTVNMDSPVGKQLAIILEHVAKLEAVAKFIKVKTGAYCIPSRLEEHAPMIRETAEPREVSPLEDMLKTIADRIEIVGSDIDTIVRGLQI